MYLAPHVPALYTKIRNRALIQYFRWDDSLVRRLALDALANAFYIYSPYMSADMRRMAEAFNTTVAALEDELMQLILDGQIQARIDSHNKVSAGQSGLNVFSSFIRLFHSTCYRSCLPKMPISGATHSKNRWRLVKSSRGGHDCLSFERPFCVIRFTSK